MALLVWASDRPGKIQRDRKLSLDALHPSSLVSVPCCGKQNWTPRENSRGDA